MLFNTQLAIPSAKNDPSGLIIFSSTLTKIYKTDISPESSSVWKTIFTNANVHFSDGIHSIGVGTVDQIAVCISDNNNVKPAEVVYSTDGGTTWNVTSIRKTFPTWSFPQSPLWMGSNLYLCSGYNQFVSPAKVNGGLFFASFTTRDFGPRVIMSSDGGLTWKNMSNGLPSIPVLRLVSDPTTSYIYAGTFAGVYISTDMGSSWSRFGNSLPSVPVKDLYVSPTTLQVATFGRGIWQANLATVATPSSESTTSSSLSAGAIAGIVIGAFVFCVCLVALFYFYVCQTKAETSITYTSPDVGIEKTGTQIAVQTSSDADLSKI